MTKSRFDNLELERPANQGPATPKLSRFDEPPVERQPVPPQHGVPHDVAPALGTNRFAASGDEGVALELASDAQPFRRCPSCKRDSTRYELRCKFCGTALDSPEAQAFNDELWKRIQAESAAEKAEHAKHQAAALQAAQEQHEALVAAQRKVGEELARRASGDPSDTMSSKWRIGLAITGAVLLSAAWELHRFPVLRVVLGGVGLVSLMAALPGQLWLTIGRPSNRRRWWF